MKLWYLKEASWSYSSNTSNDIWIHVCRAGKSFQTWGRMELLFAVLESFVIELKYTGLGEACSSQNSKLGKIQTFSDLFLIIKVSYSCQFYWNSPDYITFYLWRKHLMWLCLFVSPSMIKETQSWLKYPEKWQIIGKQTWVTPHERLYLRNHKFTQKKRATRDIYCFFVHWMSFSDQISKVYEIFRHFY